MVVVRQTVPCLTERGRRRARRSTLLPYFFAEKLASCSSKIERAAAVHSEVFLQMEAKRVGDYS